LNNSKIRPLSTLQVDALTVEIYDSPADVALAASLKAGRRLQSAIEQRDLAVAIFATGRSQIQFLSHLTDLKSDSRSDSKPAPDWQRIIGFHLDEYLGIAADHPASFRHYLSHHLTSRVPLKQFYPIAGDGLLPLDICQEYEKLLRSHPADLCCLGIGDNGHLAFNDPAVANFDDPRWVKIVRLDEKNRQQQAASGDFASLSSVPQYAFTLTLSAIRSTRHSLCLAFGQSKAAIVKQLLTVPIAASCPASMLRQMPQALLLLDRAAASQVL
jgi:glucosamine-6-phosphate deaminase